MSEWWNQLRWSAKAQGWYAKTDDVLLFVPETVYQRHLKVYLQSVGLEPKTDTERVQLTEEERKRLYEAESTFLANLEYWRDIHEKGVEMYPRNSTQSVMLSMPHDDSAYLAHVQAVVGQSRRIGKACGKANLPFSRCIRARC